MEGANPMWNAILKWSLAQTDGTEPSEVRPMSAEDRAFLDAVLNDMVVDVAAKMKELSLVLQAPETEEGLRSILKDDDRKYDDAVDEVIGRKLAALDELEPHVEHIHGACDLHKVGGLVPLVALLDSADDRIVAAAARVISVVVQNNPTTQQHAEQDADVTRRLVRQLNREDAPESVQRLVLLAVSSMVGENAEMARVFGARGGLDGAVRLWSSPATGHRARTRAGLLLLKLSAQLPGEFPVPASADVLEGCRLAVASTEDNAVTLREMGLRVAAAAAKTDAEAVRGCAPLVDAVRSRRAAIDAMEAEEDREAAADELRYMGELSL